MPMRNLRRSSRAALLAAIGVLGLCGLGFRALSAELSRPAHAVLLGNEDLARLPMQLGDWQGRAMALDEALIQATDTDAHISRVYTNGTQSVVLFVAYGVRARDLMPHRPEVCYPGAGWTYRTGQSEQLALPDGTTLPCTIYRFDRGGLGQQSTAVLNYYIVDGQVSPDESLLRSRAWRGSGGIRYMTQVQISAMEGGPMQAVPVEQQVRDFAQAAAVAIYGLMPTPETAEARP